MIICPNCNEEIEDDSYFCDQCGQALLFCENCGRVGKGRRCTFCGGMMVSPEKRDAKEDMGVTNSWTETVSRVPQPVAVTKQEFHAFVQQPLPKGIPQLSLYNGNLNIRIVGYNGAIIGRRQGTFKEFFVNNKYVSGVHAQLSYNVKAGWCITDKHSSNGTMINKRKLQPDVPMALHDGDILSLANVNLQVTI